MPYIEQEIRRRIDPDLDRLIDTVLDHPGLHTAGVVTYVIFKLLRKIFGGKFYMRALGIGAIICAILEWYRRDCADYEDEKIQQNGDVK